MFLSMKAKKLTAMLVALALSTVPCINTVMAEGTVQTVPKNANGEQKNADAAASSQENANKEKSETESINNTNQENTNSDDGNAEMQGTAENSGNANADTGNSEVKDSADNIENADTQKTKKSKKEKNKKMHANPVDSTQKYAVIALILGVVFAVAKIIAGIRSQNDD